MGFWDSLFKGVPLEGDRTAAEKTCSSCYEKKGSSFMEEYSLELYGNNLSNTDNSFSENGVSLKGSSDVYKLTYDGILARDGARDVFAVVSFGNDFSSEGQKYYPMHKTAGRAFEVLFPQEGPTNLNITFKDGADHWDNNSGKGYRYMGKGG